MALPSSGQLSLGDIATEQSVTLSNVSLRSMSNTAGFTSPDAVSEFYGYSGTPVVCNNDYALDFDGVNDYVEGTVGTPSAFPNETFSLSMWVRIDNTSKRNLHFYSFSGTNHSQTTGYFYVHYSASVNRLVVRWKNGASQYQRTYPLHSNSTQTGIFNSTTGWTSGQRGNTDADGFTHIMVCGDKTQTSASNGIKVYWNAAELTSTVNDSSSSVTNITPNYLAIGEFTGNNSPSGGCFGGVMDEIYLYDAQLSSSNVSTIYGYGRCDENTFTTNYFTAWRMENNVNDEESKTSLTNNGATFIATP
jgi:hypothetical protein